LAVDAVSEYMIQYITKDFFLVKKTEIELGSNDPRPGDCGFSFFVYSKSFKIKLV
jgi:hypothetical protein